MPTLVFTSNDKWLCPAGVTAVTAHCVGGGGSGGGTTATPSTGGGGAGGSYAVKIVSVTPGELYDVIVGSGGVGGVLGGTNGGGSYFKDSSEVFAQGGGAGGWTNVSNVNSSPALGSSAACVGTLVRKGGNGGYGDYSLNYSGAGGGAAFYSSNGGNADRSTGGKGVAPYGGDGAGSAFGTANGEDGLVYGGAGSGAIANRAKAGVSGGDGAPGVVILTYDDPGYVDLGADLVGDSIVSLKALELGLTVDLSSNMVGVGTLSLKAQQVTPPDLSAKVANIRININGVITHWWKLNYFTKD